jgi:ribosomal protein L11 methyltransferase
MAEGTGEPVEYIEAGLEVPREFHDAVCNFILENFSVGLILEEQENSENIQIKFYVPRAAGKGFREVLARYVNEIIPGGNFFPDRIRIRNLANVEWEEAYRKSVKPIVVENVVVRPPWLKRACKGKIELILEPKMAFGTGRHETTKLCIKEILKYFRKGNTFFDLGCGSGILSILAAKLGARRVKAVDIDITAIENAKENVVLNNVSDRVDVESGSIEKVQQDAPYDFLVANLTKSTIIEMYDKIDPCVRSGGRIVLSGLAEEDLEEMARLLEEFRHLKYYIKKEGQWLAVTVLK